MKRPIIISLALCAASACNDSEKPGIADLGGMPANDAGSQNVTDLGGTPSFAVQLSDYMSAGVALIDGDGEVLSKKYISSGSAVAGLSRALHGDIALPTQPCDEGLLTVVARYGGNYVLQVDLDTAKVVGQIDTQGPSMGAAFNSNPQDILCLGGGAALVSRFEPNLDPMAAALDAGDDLLTVDLAKAGRVSRIDLSALRGKVGEAVAYARPGSIVRLGDHALVGLSRATGSFEGAEGMLAIVDLKSSAVTGFALPELRQCGTLTPVADRGDAVIVSCTGGTFGERATAGFFMVSLDSDGKAKVEHTYQSSDPLPSIYASPVSLGGTRLVGVALGDFATMAPDTAFVIDLASGEATALFSSALGGEIGSGAYRADTGLLLMPDAGKGVRVFNVGADAIEERETLALDAALPPRSVRPLRAL